MDKADEGAKSLIVDLFRHNTWANLKLLEVCEGLSDEQLDASVPGTYGSIRDTLLHIVRAEVNYVSRVTGQLPGEPLKRGQFPGIGVLKQAARWSGEELLKLALNAGPTDIVEEHGQGEHIRYKLTGLLTQAINHATEHRAQVVTILTQQGVEPPELSGWAYMEATGQLQETADDTAQSK